MRRRPRVLVLTCHLPYPPFSGGRRRELELLRRLSDDFELHLCAVTKTIEEDRQHANDLDVFRSIELFEADGTRSGRVCAQVARHTSAGARAHLARICAEDPFDLVHVEGFYLMQHLPPSSAPVLLVEQNVEFDLWRQRAAVARTELDCRRSLRECTLTRQEEVTAWVRSDACAAVTEDDAVLMRYVLPGLRVSVAPNGVDHSGGPVSRPIRPAGKEVVFFANFAYAPNVDAGLYLIEEIAPRVLADVPDARIHLVGNSPPPELTRAATPSISVSGRVPDPAPYLERAAVICCPLRIGGGIKVKVTEALRQGKAVVTTSIGAQGLARGAGSAFAVADRPELAAAETVRLLQDEAARRHLELAAARFASTLPTWDDAADELATCWESCFTPTAARAPGLALEPMPD